MDTGRKQERKNHLMPCTMKHTYAYIWHDYFRTFNLIVVFCFFFSTFLPQLHIILLFNVQWHGAFWHFDCAIEIAFWTCSRVNTCYDLSTVHRESKYCSYFSNCLKRLFVPSLPCKSLTPGAIFKGIKLHHLTVTILICLWFEIEIIVLFGCVVLFFCSFLSLLFVIGSYIFSSCCSFYRFDTNKSTKGASKLRRDLINTEIANLRDLLPLPQSTRQRLSQLQLMALVCVYVRKANYFQQGMFNQICTYKSYSMPEF